MGCVQAKSSAKSSPSTEVERLKTRYEYVGRRRDGGDVTAGPRRSTGQRQRYPERETVESPERDGRLLFGREKEERKRNGNVSKRNSDNSVVAAVEEGGDRDLAEGWPEWLVDNVPRKVLAGLVPRSADSYEKLDKVGQGTYSNVYKARDRDTGKIVALKKVRFDTSESESIKFMAREITMLRILDHPNIIKLQGLATSRMQYSLYLVFEFMQSDLSRIISRPERLTESQVKCYMSQLLSGLEHCHSRGILHRDIKGSNLLIDRDGMLKIADFGLANFYSTNKKQTLTNRVVTLWYRAPELLLGATDYGVGIDLWSAGCLLAEMFLGRPVMPGRTEVEQLHRIFKLCGTPSEEYWRKLKLSTTFRPPKMYKPTFVQAFSDFPPSSLGLLKNLLSLDPAYRGSASSALQNQFFSTSPLACELSELPFIQNDVDELDLPRLGQKKKRRHRMKRSQTHDVLKMTDSDKTRDNETKDIEIVVAESNSRTEEQTNSILTGTTSFNQNPANLNNRGASSSNPAGQKESSVITKSPLRHSNNVSNRKKAANGKRDQSDKRLPPLPTKPHIRITNYTRETQIHRSVSTREFRSVNQREPLNV